MSKSQNVEAIVIQWLNSNLGTGWTAYGDKPKTLPDRYVLVARTAGGREALVLDTAEIQIEVYSKVSRYDASTKADAIADEIYKLTEVHEDITRSKVNSVIQLDDTVTQTWRYQIYVDVYLRR